MSVPESRFREVAGHFATGIVVVTGFDADGPAGFTAQSFTSVSLDPPLVSICPGIEVASWARISPSGRFCVNVLAEDQESLSRTFATKEADKFDIGGWSADVCAAGPVLNGVLAWLGCRVMRSHTAGDHLIVVAEVEELGLGPGSGPLVFYRGGYAGISS